MIFSNLVATIRADLDAIKDDLGEFVTTVKTDTTTMLGLRAGEGGANQAGASGSNAAKLIEWEEELYDNPDLLCEDPQESDWENFTKSNPVKDEEVEVLLSGAQSDLVPELYRELVPSRTTHADFFKRLIYYRNRMTLAAKSRVQELTLDNGDEEETGWEDDEPSADEQAVVPKSEHVSAPPSIDRAEYEKVRDEAAALKAELVKVKSELEQSRSRVSELEAKLAESEQARKALEEIQELPHKKLAHESVDKVPVDEVEEDSSRDDNETPASFTAPSVSASAATSWEALPASSDSSSNEEPVMLTKSGEDEEDDWE